MNRYILRALQFAAKHDQWNSYAEDALTIKCIDKLVLYEMVERNEFDQFKITPFGKRIAITPFGKRIAPYMEVTK